MEYPSLKQAPNLHCHPQCSLTDSACNVFFPLQVCNGTWTSQLTLHYFDHLQQRNKTAVASCQDSASSLDQPPALLNCMATKVTVKLPLGARLKRVKVLDEDATGSTLTALTQTAETVQMPRSQDKVRMFCNFIQLVNIWPGLELKMDYLAGCHLGNYLF